MFVCMCTGQCIRHSHTLHRVWNDVIYTICSAQCVCVCVCWWMKLTFSPASLFLLSLGWSCSSHHEPTRLNARTHIRTQRHTHKIICILSSTLFICMFLCLCSPFHLSSFCSIHIVTHVVIYSSILLSLHPSIPHDGQSVLSAIYPLTCLSVDLFLYYLLIYN